jgi:hypothetical protein
VCRAFAGPKGSALRAGRFFQLQIGGRADEGSVDDSSLRERSTVYT